MNIITPTIGRKVWFWLNGTRIGVPAAAQPQSQDPAQAMDATIVFVHGDRLVNLLVLDHRGLSWPISSVTLYQEGDAITQGMYAQWMPYQVKQAAKEEANQDEYTGPDFIGDDVFMVGDVVQLKSGGPKMTVESLHKSDAPAHEGSVTCAWQLDHNGQLLRGVFQTEVLTNISAENDFLDIVVIQGDDADEQPAGESLARTGLTFGQAIEALKAGQRVARAGWNGKGMWLALSCGETREVPAAGFWSPHNRAHAEAQGGTAKVLPSITMKTATGEILMGWLASQSDMLAEDWTLVE